MPRGPSWQPEYFPIEEEGDHVEAAKNLNIFNWEAAPGIVLLKAPRSPRQQREPCSLTSPKRKLLTVPQGVLPTDWCPAGPHWLNPNPQSPPMQINPCIPLLGSGGGGWGWWWPFVGHQSTPMPLLCSTDNQIRDIDSSWIVAHYIIIRKQTEIFDLCEAN